MASVLPCGCSVPGASVSKARTGDTDFEDILYEFYSICAPNYFLLRADLFGCTKYMMLVVMTIIATLHSFR